MTWLSAFLLLTVSWHSDAKLQTALYHPEEALLYLQYSRAAFCVDDAIRDWDCGDMCDYSVNKSMAPRHVTVFGPGDKSGVKGYTAVLPVHGPTTCLVAFRGSVNWKNWKTDADKALTRFPDKTWTNGAAGRCPGCKIHTGFSVAYTELKKQMLVQLSHLDCKRVHIAGHSLGAGLATVAAAHLRLYESQFEVNVLWTFGSPRVGNQEFVDTFVNISMQKGAYPPSWRVVHYQDPVPHTGLVRWGYVHLPQEVWYGDAESVNKPMVCPWDLHNLREDYTACGTWDMSFQDLAEGLATNDHVRYLNLTFMLAKMNYECRPENICAQEGYKSAHTFRAFLALILLAGCCLCRVFTIHETQQESGLTFVEAIKSTPGKLLPRCCRQRVVADCSVSIPNNEALSEVEMLGVGEQVVGAPKT